MAFMKDTSPAVIGIAVGSVVLACILIIVLLMKCIAYVRYNTYDQGRGFAIYPKWRTA